MTRWKITKNQRWYIRKAKDRRSEEAFEEVREELKSRNLGSPNMRDTPPMDRVKEWVI